jgi:hypothetical protein
MAKHSINAARFALLTAYATPSTGEQGKSETLRAANCGQARMFADGDRRGDASCRQNVRQLIQV